jgi:hypothetical protein
MPVLDGGMRPFAAFSTYQAGKPLSLGKGRLLFLDEWDEKTVLDFLGSAGVTPLFPSFPRGILAARHAGGGREMVFLANPSDALAVLPPPENPGGCDWKPLWGAKRTWKAGKGTTIPPWTVTAWMPLEKEAFP